MDSLVACTAPGSFSPLTSTFRTGIAAGLLNTAPVVALGLPAGTQVIAIIRVWDNKGGIITSWDQVLNDGNTVRGESNPVPIILGGVSSSGVTFPNPDLIGLTSFELGICPEPSVIALSFVGIGALLLCRRK